MFTFEQIEAMEEEKEAIYQATIEMEAGKKKFVPPMMTDEPEGGLEDE